MMVIMKLFIVNAPDLELVHILALLSNFAVNFLASITRFASLNSSFPF